MLQVNHLLVAPSRITIRGLVGIQNPDTSDGVRVDAFTSGSPFTTLAEGCSAEANTTVVVSAIEGSIVPGEFLRIDEELLLVRAVHADNHTLEVLRAQGDTAAAVHEARAVVTKELPVYDTPLRTGLVHATGSNSSLRLDASAPATRGFYDGYVIVVDVDADFRTTEDNFERVIASYGADRTVVLSSSIGAVPTNASTYTISSRASRLFSLGARWEKAVGALTLQVGGSTCGTSRSICAEGEPGRTVLVRATDLNGTTLTLGDAAAAGIALGSYVQIDAEVMRVDAIDGDTLTVARGQAYTGVTSHQAGAFVAAAMVPGLEYRFSFRVTNPGVVQESPIVTVSASGTTTFEVAAMNKDVTTVIGEVGAIQGDASPLRVYRGFLNEGKDIGQSTPFPQSRNVLTVTLTTNVFLATVVGGETSTITISGLTGSVTEDSDTFAVDDLLFPVDSGYVAFADEFSPNSTFSIASSASGLPNAYLGFEIVVDGETRTISSYEDGSVTLSEPLSFAPTSASAYTVYSKFSAVFNTTAQWTADTGSLVVTVLAGRSVTPNVIYKFSFELMNPTDNQFPDISQEAPDVFISASGSEDLPHVQMTPDATTLLGLPGAAIGDAKPLKLYKNSFSLIRVGQANPFPYAENTITVTFATNVPMTRRSLNAFVLSGLTGTATLTTNVPITDVPLRQSLIASVRSASAVTLDANASKVPGLYRGHAITIGGEVRTIVSYSAAREAVVSPEFNSLPAAGVNFSISGQTGLIFGASASWNQDQGRLDMPLVGETTLSAALSATDTTAELADAEAAKVGVATYLHIGDEYLRVDAVDGNTVTVERAQAGSAAAEHASGAAVVKATSPGVFLKFSFPLQNPAEAHVSPALIAFSAVPIKEIPVLSAGKGYIAGRIKFTGGGGGTGLDATFSVDGSTGALDAFSISSGGSGFISSPPITLHYVHAALSADADDSTTTLSVDDADAPGFVPGALLTVGSERVIVSTVASDGLSITVSRAAAGTVSAAHASGAHVEWLRNEMTNSITQILISAGGLGYIAGTIKVTGGCDYGSPCVAATATFTVDADGTIDDIALTDHGSEYARDPSDDLDQTYRPEVVRIFYPASEGVDVVMTDTIVDLTNSPGGATSGCSVGLAIFTSGGGGQGFKAVVASVTGGAIATWTVVTHGTGYTDTPLLWVDDDGTCKCAGSAANSIGALNPCFTTLRARGASLLAVRASGGSVAASLKSGAIATQAVERDFTSVPAVPMADPPPTAGDAAPLKVYAPEFVVRSVGQSTRFPLSLNTLSLSLAANFVITNGTAITLSGLSGADVLVRAASVAANPESSAISFTLDASAPADADAFVNYTLRVSGQDRTVTSYSADRVAVMDSPFPGAPLSGTPYAVFLGGSTASISVADGSGAANHIKYAAAPDGESGKALWDSGDRSVVLHVIETIPAFELHVLEFKMYNLAAQVCIPPPESPCLLD